MSKLDEILKVTPGDSQRTLSELVHKVITKNRVTFDGIAETLVDDAGDDATEVYRRLVKEMFADRVIHWGRVTVFFALLEFRRRSDKLDVEIFYRLDGGATEYALLEKRTLLRRTCLCSSLC